MKILIIYTYVISSLLFFTAEINGNKKISYSSSLSFSWGEFCQVDSQCSKKLKCINNICKCPYGYQWSYQQFSCVPFTQVSCYYNKQCQDADPNQACYEIFNHCDCKIGYYLNTTNLRCMKGHTKLRNNYCQVSDQCQESMICLNNTCKCDFGYTWMEYSNSCAYNGTCYSDIHCQDTDSNRICVNNSCVCKKNYYSGYAKQCKKAPQRNYYCIFDSQCKYGEKYGICVNGKCKCSKNQFISLNNKTCLSTTSTQHCNYDWQCQDVDSNKICEKGACKCKSNYYNTSSSEVCLIKHGHNEDCENDNSCQGSLKCLSKRKYYYSKACKCPNGYTRSNDATCIYNGRCSYDSQCQDMDDNKVCKNNSCICKEGFKLSSRNNTCISSLGQLCIDNKDCITQNSFCNNLFSSQSRCTCKPKYTQSDNNECILIHCKEDSDCSIKQDEIIIDIGLVCTDRKCECRQNFYYNEDLIICVEYSLIYLNYYWFLLIIPIALLICYVRMKCLLSVRRNIRNNRTNHTNTSIDGNINQRQNRCSQHQQSQYSQLNQQCYEDLPPSYEKAISQPKPVNV